MPPIKVEHVRLSVKLVTVLAVLGFIGNRLWIAAAAWTTFTTGFDTFRSDVNAHFAKLEGRKPGEKKKAVFENVPIGRGATAADLTGMAIFLATPEADYVVAQTFGVDGGNWLA